MQVRLIAKLLLGLCFLALQANAQNCQNQRYRAAVFDSITVERDIIFANVPSLPAVYINETQTVDVDLRMDVFQPYGDTIAKRPAFIMTYGGGFLLGTREFDDVQSLCDSLAHRGYVSVAFDYRLGMNVLDGASAERAVYRATQDYSSVVRYIKEHADEYGIDTNYIFIGGYSAGAFAAMHMAYTEDWQRPASTYAKPAPFPRPDLGCGDCSGNSYQHSRKVRGVVNLWGAIGDLSWFDSTDINTPLISFHGDVDLIVPYGCGLPFTALFTMPTVCGSAEIKLRTDSLGLDHEFHPFPGVGHNIWGVPDGVGVSFPNQNYPFIFNKIMDFLYRNIQPETSPISGPGVMCKHTVGTYSIDHHPGSQYCWEVDGGTIVWQSPDGASIEVLWDTLVFNEVRITEVSPLLSVGQTQVKRVDILLVPTLEAGLGGSICPGEGLILQGQATHTYIWSHGDENLRTRVTPEESKWYYLMAVHPNGCVVMDSVFVEIHPAPQLSVNNDTICAGEQAVVSVNGDAVSYEWSNGSSSQTLILTATKDESYQVTATTAKGCQATAEASVKVLVCTGINEGDMLEVRVYPNPTQNRLFVSWPATSGELIMRDLSGKVVSRHLLQNGINELSLPLLPTGVYFYSIYADQHFPVEGKCWVAY